MFSLLVESLHKLTSVFNIRKSYFIMLVHQSDMVTLAGYQNFIILASTEFVTGVSLNDSEYR